MGQAMVLDRGPRAGTQGILGGQRPPKESSKTQRFLADFQTILGILLELFIAKVLVM